MVGGFSALGKERIGISTRRECLPDQPADGYPPCDELQHSTEWTDQFLGKLGRTRTRLEQVAGLIPTGTASKVQGFVLGHGGVGGVDWHID